MMTAFDVFDAFMFGGAKGPYLKTYKILDDVRTSSCKKSVENDVLTLSIDLPGVKPSDVDVSLEEIDVVRITAKKNDKVIVDSRYYVDPGYDASSAVPILDLGVLNIKFSKSPERQTKKIKVLTA